MQQARIFNRRTWYAIASLLFFMLLAFYLPSCNNNKKGDVVTGCVTLSSKQVQDEWVTPGYTNPFSANRIMYLDFQSTYDPTNGNIAVTVQAYKGDNDAIGNVISLVTGSDCPTTLPPVLVGKNIVDLDKLDILNADGTLKKFDFIKLTPKVFSENGKDYLSFSIAVDDGGVNSERAPSLPCPPCIYCRPPCDTAIDSDTIPVPLSRDTAAPKL